MNKQLCNRIKHIKHAKMYGNTRFLPLKSKIPKNNKTNHFHFKLQVSMANDLIRCALLHITQTQVSCLFFFFVFAPTCSQSPGKKFIYLQPKKGVGHRYKEHYYDGLT